MTVSPTVTGSKEARLQLTATKIVKIIQTMEQQSTVKLQQLQDDGDGGGGKESGGVVPGQRLFVEVLTQPASEQEADATLAGQAVEVDFAPGDFVETLNAQLEWVVAQVWSIRLQSGIPAAAATR